MRSRTTIEVAVRFREPSWIIASGGGIGRTRGLDVGIVLRKGYSESIVFGTRNQLKSSRSRCTSSIAICPRNDSTALMGSDSRADRPVLPDRNKWAQPIRDARDVALRCTPDHASSVRSSRAPECPDARNPKSSAQNGKRPSPT
jgi:hypothetical protein